MKSDNWIDINDNKMGADQYFDQLMKEFPVLRKDIEDEDGKMIHLRMEIFADYTIDQIKTKNLKELQRCFHFQESKIDLINSDLENALTVSYCESMLLGEVADQMDKVVEYMPVKLKVKYLDYQKYYNKLVDSAKSKRLFPEGNPEDSSPSASPDKGR